METGGKLQQIKQRQAKNKQYIHSDAHLLADELSRQFGDKKHFGFYLKQAMTHNHDYLRKLAAEVFESKTVKNPAKLFSYLIKKRNDEAKKSN